MQRYSDQSWNDRQFHLVRSHRTKGTLVRAIHHRSPRKVDIFLLVPHGCRAVLPFHFSSITTSKGRIVLIFLTEFSRITHSRNGSLTVVHFSPLRVCFLHLLRFFALLIHQNNTTAIDKKQTCHKHLLG